MLFRFCVLMTALVLCASSAWAQRGRVIVSPSGGFRGFSPGHVVVRPGGRVVVHDGRRVVIGGGFSRVSVSPSRFSFFSLSVGTPFVTAPFFFEPPVFVTSPFVTFPPVVYVPSTPIFVAPPVGVVDPLVRREPLAPDVIGNRRLPPEDERLQPQPAPPAWADDLRIETLDAHRVRLTWTGATRGVARMEFFTADAQQRDVNKRIITAPPFDGTLYFDAAPAVIGVIVVYNDGVTMTLTVPYKG